MRFDRTNLRRMQAAAALVTLVVALGCGGDGSTPTSPQVVVPTSTPPPSASVLGTYGTQPCCCGFWTATFVRASRTESWTCWGWIEIRSQSGSQISGITDMERGDARTCSGDHRCANGSDWSSGQIDGATGALSWALDGGGRFIPNRVADESGCTVVSGGDTFTGSLVGDTLTVTNGWVLSCGGTTAQLTVTGRGVKIP